MRNWAMVVAVGVAFAAWPLAAQAQVKVGVVVSMTGPAATLGVPQKNTIPLLPQSVAGKKVEYIVLDDASNVTSARRNVERLVNEDKVDVILGPSISPTSMAVVEVAVKSKTPLISIAASRAIIWPMNEDRKWVFKTTYNDNIFATATVGHMKQTGVKKLAVIAFNDAYGESWTREVNKAIEGSSIEIVASEKFNKNDTSVTAQVLKVLSSNPDAVLIVAAGTPGVLPQATLVERGYKGKVYQTTGVTTNEFLQIGGKLVEGAIVAQTPAIVAAQLPEGHPTKNISLQFREKYEAAHGANSYSPFASNFYDGWLVLEDALKRVDPKIEPGDAAFRAALRDQIERSDKVVTTGGIVKMSPDDHSGFSAEAPVLITSKNGQWIYLPN